jgi:hypothetical protein
MKLWQMQVALVLVAALLLLGFRALPGSGASSYSKRCQAPEDQVVLDACKEAGLLK